MGAVSLHKIDFHKFIQAIDLCKGDVFLVTGEGDRLNLKSKLCRLIGLTDNAKVVGSNPEDDSFLFRFNLYGDKVLEDKEEGK